MVLHGQTQSYHIVLIRDISEHDFGTFQTENYPYVVLLLNQTDVHQNENNPEYFTFHWAVSFVKNSLFAYQNKFINN